LASPTRSTTVPHPTFTDADVVSNRANTALCASRIWSVTDTEQRSIDLSRMSFGPIRFRH